MSVHTTLTNNYELTNGVATYECRTSEYRYQELIAIEVDYNQCIIKTLTVIKKNQFYILYTFYYFNNQCSNNLWTKHKLAGWLVHLCYSNSLKMAPGCRNVCVTCSVSRNAFFGRNITSIMLPVQQLPNIHDYYGWLSVHRLHNYREWMNFVIIWSRVVQSNRPSSRYTTSLTASRIITVISKISHHRKTTIGL